MSFLALPNEVLLEVLKELDAVADLNALARTNRRLYRVTIGRLYERDVSHTGGWALHWAAKRGYERAVKQSLEAGAILRPNTFGELGTLNLAVKHGHTSIVALLIATGADVNAGLDDATPLLFALTNLRVEIFKTLIDHGAHVNWFYSNANPMPRCSMLHLAALLRTPAFVLMLLEKGAWVDREDRDGQTPLHWAVSDEYIKDLKDWTHGMGNREGKMALIRLLLAHGADPVAPDHLGNTPRELSRRFEHGSYSRLLGTSPARAGDRIIVRGQRVGSRFAAVWRRFVR